MRSQRLVGFTSGGIHLVMFSTCEPPRRRGLPRSRGSAGRELPRGSAQRRHHGLRLRRALGLGDEEARPAGWRKEERLGRVGAVFGAGSSVAADKGNGGLDVGR